MRGLALIMLMVLGVGVTPAFAGPSAADAGSGKIPVNERLNSLSPREAARAERSRARAANTVAPSTTAVANTPEKSRAADARRDAQAKDHARSARRFAPADRDERRKMTRQDRRRDEDRSQEARRHEDRHWDDRRLDDRRFEAARSRHRYVSRHVPRVGDVVERGVPLYRLPRRYAADYPPYVGADGSPWPRPRPFGFFFFRPNEEDY